MLEVRKLVKRIAKLEGLAKEFYRHIHRGKVPHFGIRNTKHFAVGSSTGGIQEAIDDVTA